MPIPLDEMERRLLEDAGYVEVTKTHHGRTPTTLIRLTRRGRLAFDDYTTALHALLNGPTNLQEES